MWSDVQGISTETAPHHDGRSASGTFPESFSDSVDVALVRNKNGSRTPHTRNKPSSRQ